jgi:hypothetical protein
MVSSVHFFDEPNSTLDVITSLTEILLRDIDRLRAEVESFESDDALWTTLPGTSNPPGALALHICGNLQHFIGATLGGSGYVRDRDAEFAARDLPRSAVLEQIAVTRRVVESTLDAMEASRLDEPFPIDKFMEGKSTGFALLHFLGHLSYHLGQINYSRRVKGEGKRKK